MPEYILPGDEEEVEIIPEDTVLTADVIEIKEQVDEKFKDRDTGDPVVRAVFKFAVTEDGPYHGNYLFGKVRVFFGNQVSRQIKQWAEAILNQQLPAKFKLNTDALLNMPCRVVIGVEEWADKKDPEPDPDKKRMFRKNVVTDVMPPRTDGPAAWAPGEDEEPF